MNNKQFLEGVHEGMPICMGYFSVSMAFGLTAVMSGIPVWAAVLISLTNVTSAGQFAGVNIMAVNGAFLEIALTTLIINIRYFLMSISVSQKVEEKMTMMQRLAISFGITDEIFAVSTRRKENLTASYMFGLILISVVGWTAGTFVGAVATSIMPKMLLNALGIALYGMFIAIIIPPARENKNVLFTIVFAIAVSVVCKYIPKIKELSSGWLMVIITIIVCLIAAWLFPVEDNKKEEEKI